ncbi:acyl-[ACP]--phospholipid O-acyltransferase [Neptunomonas qingdaonensis]|uniref:Acyl-[acyl-carrier-protein]-phospholipid O-acyltransferase / long-chain-fatty-acid--[acyl-carrier-protein] ligase n=1 Tax=Neptunomonas qingdaonensis TaxID=1045558 RepID=A0A1I2VAB7_9GAMM|nr:acyl-[ACP]--phospholipid O-acyltransferase [Neptunomonas qingdaonensis]SFG86110.1 acyl-[acyl-carrier-protein]-phospholipid O-acyltransferase / long-chain-fatty-acid--[acyl-carrier-protein] ligase [Neptunomonas qingdaonensis]
MDKLLKITGSLAYLAAVFLNAFVDLGHKIVIQNTIFKVYDDQTQVILTAIINGLILLPFILLLSPSAFVADKYPKNKVLKVAAWFAVGLTLAITFCYYQGWFWAAFAMTFLLAIQSAFYSPAKYGYIKPLFGKEGLVPANALVQAVTIVAILAGTVVYSLFFESLYPEGATDSSAILLAIAPLGWILVFNAVLELLAMYRLPTLEQGEPSKQFSVPDYIKGKLIASNLKAVNNRAVIRLSIIGLATFWSVGQVLLSAFPSYAKDSFGVTNTVIIQGVLACTGLGIVFGSWLAGRASRHYIETGLVPLGALGVAFSLWLLPSITTLQGQALLFTVVGVSGGLFIVPLNALIQFHAEDHEMGKVLAVNNWVQNVAMASFLALTVVFSLQGFDSRTLLQIIAAVALIGGLYTIVKLPQSLVRVILSSLMSKRYRVSVQGMKNIPSSGGVLLLGNHISWVDWAIIQIATPRPIRFVMLKSIYDKWYLNSFLKMMGCVPIQPGTSSRDSLAKVTEALNAGEVVCIFPEGSISRTGHLAEFRRGYEIACKEANDNVSIVPFYLRGLWGSKFSHSSERLKRHSSRGIKRDIVVSFGAPLDKNTAVDVLKRRVFDLSISSWQNYVEQLPTLAEAWVTTAKQQGTSLAIADTTGADMSGLSALAGAMAISRRIGKLSPEEQVGLLVPTSAGGVLANMASLMAGKTVVNLNYSASVDALLSAVKQANITTIYTSERFVKKLAKRGVDLTPLFDGVQLVYLEELKKTIGKGELLSHWLMAKLLPASLLTRLVCKQRDPLATAAILFSSGSEGAPKGVMLSHRNIMANVKQAADVLNMNDDDVIMASLPLFHAFGLTVTQFLPLIEGLPMICHPDPTDALGIAKAVAKHQATVMCGTSTFLRLFARNHKVHPLMFDSLRIVVSGAEKLNSDVRDSFQLKFGKPILEGYGCTETTPVASVNLPDALDTHYWKVQKGGKQGTVGMPLPGTSFKIVDPNTFAELTTGEAGMILIGGVQVMQGYLNNPEKNAEVLKQIEDQRWYVTGDKGSIDEQGFLTILDRYSRFAKIAGEMISLSELEQNVRNAIPEKDIELVAINLPCDKKGESITLLYEGHLETSGVRQTMLANGVSGLMIPANWVAVDTVPKLGSGKNDFATAKKLALSETA